MDEARDASTHMMTLIDNLMWTIILRHFGNDLEIANEVIVNAPRTSAICIPLVVEVDKAEPGV
jgi:hypothetical protein